MFILEIAVTISFTFHVLLSRLVQPLIRLRSKLDFYGLKVNSQNVSVNYFIGASIFLISGDGCMVACLPVRNGNKHVSEIALIALDLRDTLSDLEIPVCHVSHLYMYNSVS